MPKKPQRWNPSFSGNKLSRFINLDKNLKVTLRFLWKTQTNRLSKKASYFKRKKLKASSSYEKHQPLDCQKRGQIPRKLEKRWDSKLAWSSIFAVLILSGSMVPQMSAEMKRAPVTSARYSSLEEEEERIPYIELLNSFPLLCLL